LPAGRWKTRKSKRFFFEKKKQKTFADMGRWWFQPDGPIKAKVFCALFFKKALLACFSSRCPAAKAAA
jgi:hypothetical protein